MSDGLFEFGRGGFDGDDVVALRSFNPAIDSVGGVHRMQQYDNHRRWQVFLEFQRGGQRDSS